MPGPRAKVVFLSHAAERTGPPILLYRFLRWLGPDRPFDVELVFLEGGDLLDEFAALAPVHVLDEWRPGRPTAVTRSVAAHLRAEGAGDRVRHAALARRLADVGPHDLVFINTAGSVRALRYLPDSPRKVLTEVHELSVGLDFHLPPEDRALVLEVSDAYLTVADAVTEEVVERLGVDRDRITRRYGFVEDTDLEPPPAERVARARADLGLPDEALVVGASGLTHWRKAPDLFIQVARRVVETIDADVRFLWVGGSPDGPSFWPYRHDLERSGVGDLVHFVPHHADPASTFALFDVFTLPSREDAFPLVGLEAAALGCPIVSFDAGGLPELIEDDAGRCVPYPDVDAMAAAVVDLLDDPDSRHQAGAAAAARVRERHVVSVQGPGILADITRLLPA